MRASLVLASAAVITVVIGGIALFSPNGLARLNRLQTEEEALQAEVDRRTKGNERLATEIELLRGDTDASKNALEKRAREELGFIGPGEVIVTVASDGGSTSP